MPVHPRVASRMLAVRAAASLAAALALTVLAAVAVTPDLAAAQHPSSSARSSGPSIPQVAKTAGQFATLLAAVDAAGLTETLLGRGPFTLFAPTDDAFKRLPLGTVDDLLKPENRERLRTLLTYHVIAGRVSASQARTVRSAETVAGVAVRISESSGDLRINDATVRIADVPASNGVIHVIDRVLIPPTNRRASAETTSQSAAVALVDFAIDRGAPLYNDGQPAATVAIYEVAITALLTLPADALSPDTQRTLRAALRAERSEGARDRALALRRTLDEARRALEGRLEGRVETSRR